MDDERECAAWHLSFLWWVEAYGEGVCEGGADPSAGAEGLGPADHDEPAAGVLDVLAEELLLGFGVGVGGLIEEYDAFVGCELGE